MVTHFIVVPVDESQRGKDDIGGEEIIGISEEARTRNSPNLPVKAITINVTTDLLTLVGVSLRRLSVQRGFFVEREEARLVMSADIGWIDPETHGLISRSF
jgi:hypothetical protein